MTPTQNRFPLERRSSALLHLMTLMSAFSVALTEEEWTPFFILLAASAAAWLLVDSPRAGKAPLTIPKVVLNSIILLAACFLLWEISQWAAGTQNLLVALVHFILALMACKLFEPKTPRNSGQIIVLTLLSVTTAAIFSSSGMLFTICLLLYLSVLMQVVALVSMRRPLEETVATGDDGPALHEPAEIARLRFDLLSAMKKCMALAVPIALCVFLTMPRKANSNLLGSIAGEGGGSSQTGFSEIMQASVGTLAESDTIVMNVRITRNGQDIGAPYTDFYFRGSDADVYEGWQQLWQRSYTKVTANGRPVYDTIILQPQNAGDNTKAAQLWDDKGFELKQDDEKQEYELFTPEEGVLFVEGTPVAIESDRLNSVSTDPPHAYIRREAVVRPPFKYTIYSRHDYLPSENAGKPLTTPGFLGGRTRVSPQISALSRSVGGNLLPPESQNIPLEQIQPIVQRFENYLKQTYPYSLTFWQVDTSIDYTTDFILNHKQTGGSCQHFASALAMMCRAVGINARMVAGYHGGEYNTTFGYYVVRRRDAHAWVEYFLPGRGWLISDPTPANNTAEAGPGILSSWFRDISQYVQSTWLSAVVAFDDDSRTSLYNSFSGFLKTRATSAWDAVDYWGSVLRAGVWDSSVSVEDRLTTGGTLLGLAIVAVWITRKIWKFQRRRRQTKKNSRASVAASHAPLLAESFSAIQRLGHRRADQTPLEFIEHFRRRLGPAFDDARWLVETVYAVQFGGLQVDAPIRTRMVAASRRVRNAANSRELPGIPA